MRANQHVGVTVPLTSGKVPNEVSTGALRAPTTSSQVGLCCAPKDAPRVPRRCQKYRPRCSASVGLPLVPALANVVTTWAQARSRQIVTSAPSAPSGSNQWKVGVCEVTVAVDSGAIARGAGMERGPARSGGLAPSRPARSRCTDRSTCAPASSGASGTASERAVHAQKRSAHPHPSRTR
jgi:hypothetical protein